MTGKTHVAKIVQKVELIIIIVCICLIATVNAIPATPEEARAAGAASVRQVMADPPVAINAVQSGYGSSGTTAIAIGMLLVAIVGVTYAYMAKKKGRHISS